MHESVDLNQLVENALKQIEEKKYDTELLSTDITAIRIIGIAFSRFLTEMGLG